MNNNPTDKAMAEPDAQNQFWDAKSLLINFIRRAKKELIVIDAYPGVAKGECCHCVNVASCQFPTKEAA